MKGNASVPKPKKVTVKENALVGFSFALCRPPLGFFSSRINYDSEEATVQ